MRNEDIAPQSADHPVVEQPVDRGVSGSPGLTWGVGAVALRLDIATPTLRTWERRYGIGPSQRTSGGHRRYGEEDIIRVQLMGRLVARGVPAQSAARVAQSIEADGLAAALAAPDPTTSAGVGAASNLPPALAIENIIEATAIFDASSLAQTYAQVFADHGVVRGWTTVAVPALRAIGNSWAEGTIGVGSEHLATEVLGSELRAVVRAKNPQNLVPVVLASAEDEEHSLPLLAVEAALASEGFACYAMGSRLPVQSLVDVVTYIEPVAVFVWASMPRTDDGREWSGFTAAVRAPHVLLGGPGWPRQDVEGAADHVERADTLTGTVERIVSLVRDAGPARAG